MKAKEVKIGSIYVAKVNNALVPVRIDSKSESGQYTVTNLKTGRVTYFRSAAKFRREVAQGGSNGE